MAKKEELNLEDVASGEELERIKGFTSDTKKVSDKDIPTDVKFSKSQILGSNSIGFNKDVLMILLENEKSYTIEDVEKIVKVFNEREVK